MYANVTMDCQKSASAGMASDLNWKRDAPSWPNSTHSQFVDAGGLRWHVQVVGSGPVVLLVHGTGASTHSWRGVIADLAPHFTVVAPDLPGHGFTERLPDAQMTLHGMAQALAVLIGAINLEPSIAVGHSAGAAVVMRTAIDGGIRPRAIIGLNGALLPFRGVAGQVFKPLAKFLALQPFLPRFFAWRATSRSAVERLLEGTGSRPSPEDVALYARLFQSPSHVGATLAMMANWDLAPLLRDLPTLKTAVTLVAGQSDRAIPSSDAVAAAKYLHNAEIVELPGLGHLAHEEDPTLISRLIERRAGLAKNN